MSLNILLSQGHSKWHCCEGRVQVPISIPLKLRLYSEIFSLKEWCELETGAGVSQDHWKWHCSIDHIRLSIGPPLQIWLCLVLFLSYLTLNNCDREIWVIGHWRSFTLVPFESLGAVSYSSSIVNMAVSYYGLWDIHYSASKNSVTLKTGLGVVHGHWKWHHSMDHIRLSIGPPL